jgi:hypothetical protein
MININESDGNKQIGQPGKHKKFRTLPVHPINKQGQDYGQEFHQRIAQGYMLPAVAALAPQKDVTQDGYIIHWSDVFGAFRAEGNRAYDTAFTWNPVNDHI